jgi:hypothetical protein
MVVLPFVVNAEDVAHPIASATEVEAPVSVLQMLLKEGCATP